MDTETLDNETLVWKSKTNGYKKFVLIMCCLPLLIASMILAFVASSSDNTTFKTVGVILAFVLIVLIIIVFLIGKFTRIKWNVANLLFIAEDEGFYFTSANPNMQDSFFSAEWSEIVGYSVKNVKDDKATVTVYFDGPANCGFLGKNTYVDMVNITGLVILREVFANHGVAERTEK